MWAACLHYVEVATVTLWLLMSKCGVLLCPRDPLLGCTAKILDAAADFS